MCNKLLNTNRHKDSLYHAKLLLFNSVHKTIPRLHCKKKKPNIIYCFCARIELSI